MPHEGHKPIGAESQASNQTETQESVSPSVYEIRKFVTDVWNNPLLDRETIEFRNNAREKLAEFFTRSNIALEDVVAIPYGSILWNIDAESDADFKLVLKEEVDVSHLDLPFLAENNISLSFPTATPQGLVDGKNNNILLSLIITPDEYIVGNVQLADEIRKMSLDNLIGGNLYPELVQPRIDADFETYYKNWKDLDETRKETAKDIDRARQSRFQRKLEQRADQTHVPEKYKEAYQKALENIWLPELQTFAECFNHTNGELWELPRKPSGIT